MLSSSASVTSRSEGARAALSHLRHIVCFAYDTCRGVAISDKNVREGSNDGPPLKTSDPDARMTLEGQTRTRLAVNCRRRFLRADSS